MKEKLQFDEEFTARSTPQLIVIKYPQNSDICSTQPFTPADQLVILIWSRSLTLQDYNNNKNIHHQELMLWLTARWCWTWHEHVYLCLVSGESMICRSMCTRAGVGVTLELIQVSFTSLVVIYSQQKQGWIEDIIVMDHNCLNDHMIVISRTTNTTTKLERRRNSFCWHCNGQENSRHLVD